MSGYRGGYAGGNYPRGRGDSGRGRGGDRRSGRGRGGGRGGGRGSGGGRGGGRGRRGRGGGRWQEPRPSNVPRSAWSPAVEDTTPISASPLNPVRVSMVEECFKELLIIQKEEENAPATGPESSNSLRHPRRPGFGSIGTPSIVYANHFLVNVADTDLHHYHVDISPEVARREVNRAVISEFVALYGISYLGGRKPAYDGRKSMYTAGALPFSSKDFSIKLTDRDEHGNIRREKQFKVSIKLAGRPDQHHLRVFGRRSRG